MDICIAIAFRASLTNVLNPSIILIIVILVEIVIPIIAKYYIGIITSMG
jgi:hypothetical protein